MLLISGTGDINYSKNWINYLTVMKTGYISAFLKSEIPISKFHAGGRVCLESF